MSGDYPNKAKRLSEKKCFLECSSTTSEELWGCCSQQRGDTNFGSDVLYINFHSSANVSLREALGPGWFIVLSQHGGKRKLGIDSRPAKRVKVGGHRRHPVRLPPVLTRERTGSFLSHGDGVTTAKASGYPITLNAACLLSHSVNTKHLPQRENEQQSDKRYGTLAHCGHTREQGTGSGRLRRKKKRKTI